VRFDGLDQDGNTFGVIGTDDPFNGLSWTLNGSDSADNQANTSSFIATSGILPPDKVQAARELALGEVGQAGRTALPGTPVSNTSTRRSPTCPTSG